MSDRPTTAEPATPFTGPPSPAVYARIVNILGEMRERLAHLERRCEDPGSGFAVPGTPQADRAWTEAGLQGRLEALDARVNAKVAELTRLSEEVRLLGAALKSLELRHRMVQEMLSREITASQMR